MSVNGSMMRRNIKPDGLELYACACWYCIGSKRGKTRAQERREARDDIAEQLAGDPA